MFMIGLIDFISNSFFGLFLPN